LEAGGLVEPNEVCGGLIGLLERCLFTAPIARLATTRAAADSRPRTTLPSRHWRSAKLLDGRVAEPDNKHAIVLLDSQSVQIEIPCEPC